MVEFIVIALFMGWLLLSVVVGATIGRSGLPEFARMCMALSVIAVNIWLGAFVFIIAV